MQLKAKAQVKWLKLAKSSVDDKQIARLSALENLTRLDVSYTEISADGIKSLAKLSQLKINHFNTAAQ